MKSKEHYLFFDTETSGLPLNWKAPVSDTTNWPRLVQIAWVLYNEDGELIDQNDHIISPSGFRISKGSEAIHGISNERALAEGIPLIQSLNEFRIMLIKTDYLVAHNMKFDQTIMGAEYLRMEQENPVPKMNKICTMEKTVDFCKIKGKFGNKWPTLAELYDKLFNEKFEDAHNAKADIEATARCFWELRKLGEI